MNLAGLRNPVRQLAPDSLPAFRTKSHEPVAEWSAQEAVTCFASSGSVGVVDLGASQSDRKQAGSGTTREHSPKHQEANP